MSEMNKEKIDKKKFLRQMLASFFVLALIFLTIFLLEYYLSQKNIYVLLTDAFTIPWIIGISIFFLLVLKKFGAFDMLAYSMKTMVNMFKKNKNESSYQEFKEGRSKTAVSSILYLPISTIPFFILMIVFLILSSI